MSKILITGVAGFVGFHFAQRLIRSEKYEVCGIDNLNDYYDVTLKQDRLNELKRLGWSGFKKADLADLATLNDLFATFKPDIVVNLAAQAGVRYSIKNPHVYNSSNLTGFLNILECSRHHQVSHLIFASSSSVYGANRSLPYSEKDNVDHPVSLYAATKKAGELMAHSYAHLYRLPCTGLRFFTVYGPWGRPDMAYFKFTESVLQGKPIDIYNHGDMRRDFTYIDDIVESMERLLSLAPLPDPNWNALVPNPATSLAPYRIFNIGNNAPENIKDLIRYLEQGLGIKALRNFLPMQAGDVYETFADTADLYAAVGFKPYTSLEDGLNNFLDWYCSYYKINTGSVSPSKLNKTVSV